MTRPRTGFRRRSPFQRSVRAERVAPTVRIGALRPKMQLELHNLTPMARRRLQYVVGWDENAALRSFSNELY